MEVFKTAISALEGGDTMGERMGRIGRIETDFFLIFSRIPSTRTTKKIRSYPPNPPNPFSHRISTFPQGLILQIFRHLNLIGLKNL
jgi:hypothetical protein